MTNNQTTSEEFQRAYSYTIRILSKRDYSIHKLSQKLKERGFDQVTIDTVIDELVVKKFVNEENYAESKIKGWMQKGHSQDLISQKLELENIYVDDIFIQSVFDEYKISEDSQLKQLVEKKCRSIKSKEMLDFNFKKKLIRYLMSKGHSFDLAQQAIDSYIRRLDEEEIEHY